jgi:hypothetical protein
MQIKLTITEFQLTAAQCEKMALRARDLIESPQTTLAEVDALENFEEQLIRQGSALVAKDIQETIGTLTSVSKNIRDAINDLETALARLKSIRAVFGFFSAFLDFVGALILLPNGGLPAVANAFEKLNGLVDTAA